MKKVLLFLVVMLLFVSTAALAHSPQKVDTNFVMETRTFNVEFVHNVGGENSSHYVDKISIMVNGNEIITQVPSKQLNNKETFSYYMPGLKSGDEVEVMVYCSLSGNLSAKRTISK